MTPNPYLALHLAITAGLWLDLFNRRPGRLIKQ